jgi:aconitase A
MKGKNRLRKLEFKSNSKKQNKKKRCEVTKRRKKKASEMKPAHLGSCSETSYCGLQIMPWLIEPQTTKCLKNEAKHFSSSALCCEM